MGLKSEKVTFKYKYLHDNKEMAEVKRAFSLLIGLVIILSNIAFAQNSNASSYEGRPIDPSREGIDYHREGNVIVYPAQTSSEEKRMMERFNRGELSEEEMKKTAKEKLGNNFDEMKFKKSMMESQERMERKDAFSYDNGGYQSEDYGPSYEGYSKEHMIFGMLFEYIGEDLDPREIHQYCNEPDKIADTVISKLKEKIGDFQNICKRIDEQESKCEDHLKKGCSQVGAAFVREDATEMEKLNAIAYSCPVNKDAIVEACQKRNILYMEQRLNNIDEECKKKFDYGGERLVKECERFRQNQICDKEKYMERCMGGIKKEEEKPICPKYPVPSCGEGTKPETKTDANGCQYYYCVQTTRTACSQEAKECPDGSYVSRTGPNCEFQPCATTSNLCDKSKCGPQLGMPNSICSDGKTIAGPTGRCLHHADGSCGWEVISCPTTTCPEATIPTCAAGTNLQKKVDDKGCVSYYCSTPTCPSVTKPTCNTSETIQAYYDNTGCVTSYQCIKYEASCPAVTKPSCAENQSLTAKYDDKGCIVGYECVSVASSGSSSITGAAVLSNYDDFRGHCESSWQEQERICSNTPQACNKEDFIEKCRNQEKKRSSDLKAGIDKNCQTSTESKIRHAEDRCSRIEDEKKKCLEHGAKRCSQMKGNSEKCSELMTEGNVRKFIIEEAKKRCKFSNIMENEEDIRNSDKAEIILAVFNTATEDDIKKLNLFIDDLKEDLKLQDNTIYKGKISPNNFGDIKLLPFVVNAKISAARSSETAKEVKEGNMASSKAEKAASKLVSLRDSDVPAEYLYIIEDKASEVLDASNKLGDVEKKEEEKGIGYKIRLFLGLARAAEREEINQLEESKSKLKNSIDSLTKLIEEVPSDVAKAILKEQVENLKKQQADIQVLIDSKEKKAKGLFGVFG